MPTNRLPGNLKSRPSEPANARLLPWLSASLIERLVLDGWIYEVGRDRDDGEPGVKLWGAWAKTCHGSVSLSRTRATYAGSTTTSVFTELAMKQAWWACSCRFASSSGVGVFSAPNRTCGRKVTLIMANLPA